MCDATINGPDGSLDLSALAPGTLAKYCREDDTSPRRNVVGDAKRVARWPKVEADLAEFSPELSCVGLAKMHAAFGEKVDRCLDTTELTVGQLLEPLDDLRLHLDDSPWHSRTVSYHQ